MSFRGKWKLGALTLVLAAWPAFGASDGVYLFYTGGPVSKAECTQSLHGLGGFRSDDAGAGASLKPFECVPIPEGPNLDYIAQSTFRAPATATGTFTFSQSHVFASEQECLLSANLLNTNPVIYDEANATASTVVATCALLEKHYRMTLTITMNGT